MGNTFYSDDLFEISSKVEQELGKVEKRVLLLKRIRREVNNLQRDMSGINMLDSYGENFCASPGCLNVTHSVLCPPCTWKDEKREENDR